MADAKLIAHAPTDIAALLAYVGQLEGLLADLCQDSLAAAEVVRLRAEVERLSRGPQATADVAVNWLDYLLSAGALPSALFQPRRQGQG